VESGAQHDLDQCTCRTDFVFALGGNQQRIDQRCMGVRGVPAGMDVGVGLSAVLVDRSIVTIVLARVLVTRRYLNHVIRVVHQGHGSREKRRKQVEADHRDRDEAHHWRFSVPAAE
jgi:hypothetical protein